LPHLFPTFEKLRKISINFDVFLELALTPYHVLSPKPLRNEVFWTPNLPVNFDVFDLKKVRFFDPRNRVLDLETAFWTSKK
jgi:hypothetical protein